MTDWTAEEELRKSARKAEPIEKVGVEDSLVHWMLSSLSQ